MRRFSSSTKMRKELPFLAVLLTIAFLVRVIPAALHIQYPGIPHDFQFYIIGAENLLSGHQIYSVPAGWTITYCYGPLTALVHAAWIMLFGDGYFGLKMVAIFFDLASIVVFFYLAKLLMQTWQAGLATSLFAFSYITIVNSGVLGNDDVFMMLFAILSTYLLLKGKGGSAAASLGVALAFKSAAVIFIIPSILYFWKKEGFKRATIFGFTAAVIFLAILSIFYSSGHNALFPYLSAHESRIGLLEPLNLLRLNLGIIDNLIYYSHNGVLIPLEQNPLKPSVISPINEAINSLATPVLILGLSLASIWVFMRKNYTLVSMIAVFGAIILLFNNSFDSLYLLWIWPYIILSADHRRIRPSPWGPMAVFFGLTIFAALYRWEPLSYLDSVALASTLIMIPAGTYLMFRGSPLVKPITLMVFSCIMFQQTLAFDVSNEVVFIYRYINIILMVSSMLYLLYKLDEPKGI